MMNIKDIAKLAGVSASTVSKVINNKDKDISIETRKKVLKVIEEEEYTPYFNLQEKNNAKNKLIGVILKRDNKERDNIILNIEKFAREKDYNIVLNYINDENDVLVCVKNLIKKRVSGLIIDSQKYIATKNLDKLSVYINGTKNFEGKEKLCLYYRLSAAGKLATETLINYGHRKIACIIEEKDNSILEGYKTTMQKMGNDIDPLWTYKGKNIEDVKQYAIQQCLNEEVTAVICGSKEIALCVYKFVKKTGINVPDDLSILVIGDDELLSLLDNGVSAIELPIVDICKESVTFLIDLIEKREEKELNKEFKPKLIERYSIKGPSQNKQGEKIIVVGSLNMDTTIEVSRVPINGETQLAESIREFPGGKGANQAVGAGKLDGNVYIIGCVGNDISGKQLYHSLNENHVHMDGIIFDSVLSSGKAYINIDKNGESTIVVYPGANKKLNIAHINQYKYLFKDAKYCLLSMETSKEIIEYTINLCKRYNVQVLLKPSAIDKICDDILKNIDYFIPNEKELNQLVNTGESIEEKSEVLLEKGVKNIIVTLGKKGCFLCNGEYKEYFEASGFQAIDTTGGADSFISTLAVYLSEGKNLLEAIGYAIYASGLTVTRYGVQPALPDRKLLELYRDEIYLKYNILKSED